MKGLKGFRFYHFLRYLGTALIYPVFAWITSEAKLLRFMDAMTIVGMVFLLFGAVLFLSRHGDFDIMEYVSRRGLDTVRRRRTANFADFKKDKEEKRKDSCNYPFLTGLVLLAASALLSIFAY